MSVLEKKLTDVLNRAQEGGIELAIEFLDGSRSDVAAENQTWESAIAGLRIYLADIRASRA